MGFVIVHTHASQAFKKGFFMTTGSFDSSVVSLKTEGRIAFLQIERPDALNAINGDVLHALASKIETLRHDKKVQVVILSGAGEKAFVAGADLKFMQKLSGPDAAHFSRFGNQVFRSLETLPQVVIAKVQGFALGGGLELALACDFIVAGDKARFGLPEVSLGLIPGFGGTQRLVRKIGVARATEWMTTAEKYTADDALKAGLVNSVVPVSELAAATQKLATQISKNGPSAVRTAKHVLRNGVESPLDSALQLESGYFGLCFANDESAEGIGAFVEKRAANYEKF